MTSPKANLITPRSNIGGSEIYCSLRRGALPVSARSHLSTLRESIYTRSTARDDQSKQQSLDLSCVCFRKRIALPPVSETEKTALQKEVQNSTQRVFDALCFAGAENRSTEEFSGSGSRDAIRARVRHPCIYTTPRV
jgi:hypothetical protein